MDLDDGGSVTPPPGSAVADVPPMPEPEGKVLRNHLKQVPASAPAFSMMGQSSAILDGMQECAYCVLHSVELQCMYSTYRTELVMSVVSSKSLL